MILNLPPDPSLKDLQLPFEWRYSSHKHTFRFYARAFEAMIHFFGGERKPHDIFRSEVKAYRGYLEEKGWKPSTVRTYIQVGSAFYSFLQDLELIEDGYNPFREAGPRRISVTLKR